MTLQTFTVESTFTNTQRFLSSIMSLLAFCLFNSSTAFALDKAEILKMDRIIAVVDQGVITEQELA